MRALTLCADIVAKGAYSITSSAMASRLGDTVKELEAFRLLDRQISGLPAA
jgi:hypothetical protein